MKRIGLFATLAVVAIVAMGAFASISAATPTSGASSAASRAVTKIPTTKYSFTVVYDAPEYYGEVVCGGTTPSARSSPKGGTSRPVKRNPSVKGRNSCT